MLMAVRPPVLSRRRGFTKSSGLRSAKRRDDRPSACLTVFARVRSSQTRSQFSKPLTLTPRNPSRSNRTANVSSLGSFSSPLLSIWFLKNNNICCSKRWYSAALLQFKNPWRSSENRTKWSIPAFWANSAAKAGSLSGPQEVPNSSHFSHNSNCQYIPSRLGPQPSPSAEIVDLQVVVSYRLRLPRWRGSRGLTPVVSMAQPCH